MHSLIALSLLAHAFTNTFTVVTTDYRFDAPAVVPAGLTTIVLVNRGHELHHVQLLRITGADTVVAGGPNAVTPGYTAQATVMLQPGEYLMVCWIPGPDHIPHIAKGMTRPLRVSPVTNVSLTEPRSDLTIALTEYAFALSAPLTAGRRTLRVENRGVENHEAALVRLALGRSPADVVAWIDTQVGSPPAEFIGGMTALPGGAHAYFTLDVTPGRYALLCFEPAAKDGRLHVALGMIKEVDVQ